MPPFIPLADGAQAEMFYHLGGKTVESRLWFVDRSPPIVQAHLDSLVLGLDAWVSSELLPLLSVDIEYRGIEVVKWDDHIGDLISVLHTSAFGGSSSPSHSANVSVRVRFKGSSAQTFPDNANFVPGIPLDVVDTNKVAPSFQTSLRNAYVDVIDLAAGWGSFPAWRWVITSRRHNNAWRTAQAFARTDFIKTPSPYVNPRRRRLP